MYGGYVCFCPVKTTTEAHQAMRGPRCAGERMAVVTRFGLHHLLSSRA